MAEQIPSPKRDRIEEALHNPTQFRRQVAEQELKLRQRDLPSTPVRSQDAPPPPSLVQKEQK